MQDAGDELLTQGQAGVALVVVALLVGCSVRLVEEVTLEKWGTACETQTQSQPLQTPDGGHGEPLPRRSR